MFARYQIGQKLLSAVNLLHVPFDTGCASAGLKFLFVAFQAPAHSDGDQTVANFTESKRAIRNILSTAAKTPKVFEAKTEPLPISGRYQSYDLMGDFFREHPRLPCRVGNKVADRFQNTRWFIESLHEALRDDTYQMF